jgi:outer membrane protein insertion porin family
LREDIQAIYKMGNFDDVSLDISDVPGGVVATFKVTEKPVIKKINFRGNKNRTVGDLRTDMLLKEDYPLDKVKLNKDLETIVSGYKDEGFTAAQVEPLIETDAANRALVTFVITEGAQIFVDTITFQGVTAFPQKQLVKVMKTRRKKPFKQGVLSKDMEAITLFYQNRGYPFMKIVDLKSDISAEKLRVALGISIDEGPLMHFGTTTFHGDVLFTPAKLMLVVQYKPGELYKQDKLNSTLRSLNESYGAQGHIQARIKPNLVAASTDVVNVEFQITEGDVITIDHISIEGLKRTKEYVIRRELQIKEGQPYNSVLARSSIDRLNNLGFLDNVSLDIEPSTAPDRANVIFDVADGKPGRIMLGGGYDTSNGYYGHVTYQNLNFLGRGENLGADWTIGTRINSFSGNFTEPWFLGKPVGLTLGVSHTDQIQALGTNSDEPLYSGPGLFLCGPAAV